MALCSKFTRNYTRTRSELKAEEIEHVPQEEQEELALIYRSKGLPEERARELAAHMMGDKAHILDTLSREELGIDPKELGVRPGWPPFTSFSFFFRWCYCSIISLYFLT